MNLGWLVATDGYLLRELGLDIGTTADALLNALTLLQVKACPLSEPVRMKDTVWVEPQLSAEIDYSEFTNDGTLRHPIYKGLVK